MTTAELVAAWVWVFPQLETYKLRAALRWSQSCQREPLYVWLHMHDFNFIRKGRKSRARFANQDILAHDRKIVIFCPATDLGDGNDACGVITRSSAMRLEFVDLQPSQMAPEGIQANRWLGRVAAGCRLGLLPASFSSPTIAIGDYLTTIAAEIIDPCGHDRRGNRLLRLQRPRDVI